MKLCVYQRRTVSPALLYHRRTAHSKRAFVAMLFAHCVVCMTALGGNAAEATWTVPESQHLHTLQLDCISCVRVQRVVFTRWRERSFKSGGLLGLSLEPPVINRPKYCGNGALLFSLDWCSFVNSLICCCWRSTVSIVWKGIH